MKATKIVLQVVAAILIFMMGIATGVMLMQSNPRDPNFTWIESLKNKSQQDAKPAVKPTE